MLAVLVIAAATTIATAPPASAGTAGALAACNSSQAADFSQLVEIPGNSGASVPTGANPSNVLFDGDVFLLLSGTYPQVKIGAWPWDPSYGPDGNSVAAPAGWPYPGLNQYSAVLRFNNNPTGWVGAPTRTTAFGRCTVWSGPPVRLLFGVNDPDLGDNSGKWWLSYYQYFPENHN